MKKTISILLCLLIIYTNALADKGFIFASHGDREKAKIAITVDDCFDKKIMNDFMDLAHNNKAKLTFFIIGKLLKGDDDEELITKLLDQGHEIGCHSNTHMDMRKWPAGDILRNLEKFQKNLDLVLGFRYHPNVIRYPYGISCVSPGIANYNKATKDAGYKAAVYWDVVLGSEEEMLKKIQNGSIVLFHTNAKDYRVLKNIIEKLTEKYELVTVSELLDIEKVKYEMY